MKFMQSFAVVTLALASLTACNTHTTTPQLAPTETQTKPQPQTISQTPVRLQTVKILNSTVAKEQKGKMTAEQMAQCQNLGGTVAKRGMAQFEYCQITFDDAGKTCQDGSECQSGSCIATRRGVAVGQANRTGVCTQTNDDFGCRQMISKGVAQSMLCKD